MPRWKTKWVYRLRTKRQLRILRLRRRTSETPCRRRPGSWCRRLRRRRPAPPSWARRKWAPGPQALFVPRATNKSSPASITPLIPVHISHPPLSVYWPGVAVGAYCLTACARAKLPITFVRAVGHSSALMCRPDYFKIFNTHPNSFIT